MNKKILVLIGLLLLCISFAVLLIAGRTYRYVIPAAEGFDDPEDYQVELEQGQEFIRLEEKTVRNGFLNLKFRPVSRGKVYFRVSAGDESICYERIYVHRFGLITVDTFFGKARGAIAIPIAIILFLSILLWYRIQKFRNGIRTSFYQYRNINNLGWIIFLASLILNQIGFMTTKGGLDDALRSTLNSATNFAMILLPVAFIVFVLVTISNIRLMKREGRNVKNMLGVILGFALCVGTLFPLILSEYLMRSAKASAVFDVHNEQGKALYIEMAAKSSVLSAVSYLECILIASIILTTIAAKKIPAFNKDYILILGSMIRKDGTLTPLLKGRADRALEFAKMQKAETGKDLFFVPTGGQGPDEVMAEGDAIREYLLTQGIPKDRILTENRSKNTEENMKFSFKLIREHAGTEEPNVAFATTNYHVFRSGILARHQGIHAEGIGSKTKRYFWINAYIREFIATVYSGWKKHLKVILFLMALSIAASVILYFSAVL